MIHARLYCAVLVSEERTTDSDLPTEESASAVCHVCSLSVCLTLPFSLTHTLSHSALLFGDVSVVLISQLLARHAYDSIDSMYWLKCMCKLRGEAQQTSQLHPGQLLFQGLASNCTSFPPSLQCQSGISETDPWPGWHSSADVLRN